MSEQEEGGGDISIITLNTLCLSRMQYNPSFSVRI